MLPALLQRDTADECDRCLEPPDCEVCGRRAYYFDPAPLCSLACLFARQDREQR